MTLTGRRQGQRSFKSGRTAARREQRRPPRGAQLGPHQLDFQLPNLLQEASPEPSGDGMRRHSFEHTDVAGMVTHLSYQVCWGRQSQHRMRRAACRLLHAATPWAAVGQPLACVPCQPEALISHPTMHHPIMLLSTGGAAAGRGSPAGLPRRGGCPSAAHSSTACCCQRHSSGRCQPPARLL